MIEIDLLPKEFRRRKNIPLEQIFKTKAVFAVLGCLILLHLFARTVTFINTKRLDKLKASWQGLSSKKAKIDQLNVEFTRINEKIPLIKQLTSNRVLWSKKLNRISDLIIGGIWLSKLSLEQQIVQTEDADEPPEYLISLIIRGSAASRTKEEPALIGRFMQKLKDDPSFSADFAEIELGPIKKRQIAQTEVMDFILLCWFKPDRVQVLLR